jgi:anti-repressor protein
VGFLVDLARIYFRPRGSGSNAPTVNARELHGFLKSCREFSNWITDRIKKYGFIDGVDFTTSSGVSNKIVENVRVGGRPTKEYHISLNMAKELAMVERNDQGKQARLYFIELGCFCFLRLLQDKLHL